MRIVPKVTVIHDYDGYFESLVRGWVDRKEGPFKHQEVFVVAGPYKVEAVRYHSDGKELILDFYSALRTGFGELSEQDVKELIELL